jgi:hypothetical protein
MFFDLHHTLRVFITQERERKREGGGIERGIEKEIDREKKRVREIYLSIYLSISLSLSFSPSLPLSGYSIQLDHPDHPIKKPLTPPKSAKLQGPNRSLA